MASGSWGGTEAGAEALGGAPRRAQPGAALAAWVRRALPFFGPAFLVSVGYMDPGNWATDIAAGSNFGYRLLWVVLASNLMAILLQAIAATLGMRSGASLAANAKRHFRPWVAWGFFVTAELAAMATDLAEFLGAALGFHLLLGIPLVAAVFVAAVVVLGILFVSGRAARRLEAVVLGMVGVVGLAYVLEVWLARPDWHAIAVGTLVPRLGSPSALLVAIGILGATVMPHNIFLHSAAVLSRRRPGDDEHNRRALRFAYADTAVALNVAWLVNASMIVMAAAVFAGHGLSVDSIEGAHRTLVPLLGPLAAAAFAVALLSAGLSSSVTGTLAGQTILEGFVGRRVSVFWMRLVTMVPALVVVALGIDAFRMLVLSQVFLSLQLPFTVAALLCLAANPQVMGGRPVRGPALWLASGVGLLIVAANVLLLYGTLAGSAG
ncbi:MAG: Nramp family divalent metal transporter [Firmicutes bacterium]|nr:Nramp family divalent metal transporter [Bacillota bacterium]